MLYKFRRWVYVPCKTEVFIVASSDKEALEYIDKLDPKTLSYEECPMTSLRTTYELVKENVKKS